MKENLVQQKSFSFSVRIVNLYKHLTTKKKEFVLSKQILRSGTSIGANIEEAIGGQSRKDFIMKMTIAYKEARETHYWLRLLRETDYLALKEFESLSFDCQQLVKIIGAIQKSTKDNGDNP
jgi:four helix bundle protein